MISQTSRFSIGQPSTPPSSIQSLSYTTLPGSPQIGENKREHEVKSAVTKTESAGHYVFIPQRDDAVNHRFRLRYSPCSDAYYREWDECVLSRVAGSISQWEKGVYSFESVERVVDAKKNLVYLERTPGNNTGILTWKMDFRSCGLVIDQVSIKVTSHNTDGGEVLVMLSSNETKKTISHMEGLGVVKMKGFENSNNLILSIHLIGETIQQKTRLFEKDILTKGDFPLDLKITLKPPVEMFNKPVIFLGVMFSNSQETSVDRRHYRTHSCSSGRGFLHLNIVQGKNITGSKNSLPDAQVKCYLLPNDKNIKSCKTGRAKKSKTPIWDEYFLIDGIAQSQLRKKQLGIRVVNWQLGINKKNSRLGELRIGSAEMFNFIDLPSTSSGCVPQFSAEQLTNHGMFNTHSVQINEEQQNNNIATLVEKGSGKEEKLNNVTTATNKQTTPEKINQDLDCNDNHSCVDECAKSLLKITEGIDDKDKRIKDESLIFHSFQSTEMNEKADDATVQKTPEEVSGKPVKPKRPPLPNRMKFKKALETPSNKENSEEVKPPGSPNKAATPTMSRLMTKLPMSPRGRRSSWGGESDLSLQSPRSTHSPGAYERMESCQWDFMISRPKEWVYSWHVLEVGTSE